MANAPKFKEGEKILCFHGPLIYEAKCLQHKFNAESKLHEFLVHYQRWSKKWDEWVTESRMLKYTEQNLAKQKELKDQQGLAGKRNKSNQRPVKGGKDVTPSPVSQKNEGKSEDDNVDSRCSTPIGEPRAPRSRTKKRKAQGVAQSEPKEAISIDITASEDPVAETPIATNTTDDEPMEEAEIKIENMPDPEPPVETKKTMQKITAADVDFINESHLSNPNNIRLVIPPVLEKWLVEDWMQVTQSSARYLNLPAETTVADILAQYETFQREATPSEQHAENSKIVRDVELLFNKALGMHLLLKWERPQYSDLLSQHPGKEPSKIYGSHHFLRLFDKLSRVLSQLPKNSNMVQILDLCSPLLDFLATNVDLFFKMSNFTIPSAEYQRRALM